MTLAYWRFHAPLAASWPRRGIFVRRGFGFAGRRQPGTLYVVATHIGNPRDISRRAADILTSVHIIAAESVHTAENLMQSLLFGDAGEASGTRSPAAGEVEAFIEASDLDEQAKRELRSEAPTIQAVVLNGGTVVGCRNPSAEVMSRLRAAHRRTDASSRRLLSYHSNNEVERTPELLNALKDGLDVALVVRAGTPGWRDPGQALVVAAHVNGLLVRTLPGPCSVAAALSVSGLPGDRLLFEGYMPELRASRLERLRALRSVCQIYGGLDDLTPVTVAIFSDGASLSALLADACDVLGPSTHACIARELTTSHEQVLAAPLGGLVETWGAQPAEVRRGAVVVLFAFNIVKPSEHTVVAAALEGGQAQEGQQQQVGSIVRVLAKGGVPQNKIALLAMQLTGAPMAVAQEATRTLILGEYDLEDSAGAPEGEPTPQRRTLHLSGIGPNVAAEDVVAALESRGMKKAFVHMTGNRQGEQIAFARFATPAIAAQVRVSLNLARIDLGAGRPLRARWADRDGWIG